MSFGSGGGDTVVQPITATTEAARAAYLMTGGIKVTGHYLQAVFRATACTNKCLLLQCHCGLNSAAQGIRMPAPNSRG